MPFGHEAQRFEAAGAFRIELHEVAVDADLVEEHFRHRLVAALRDPTGAEVAAAQVHGDRHIRGPVRDGCVDHLRVDSGKAIRIVAAIAQELPLLGIAEIGQVHFVELEIAAAVRGECMDGAAIREAEIAVELLHVRVDLGVHGATAASEMTDARRGDRHFGGCMSVLAKKAEMVEHRMAREPQLAHHAQSLGLRLDAALKLDPVIGADGLDTIETFQEVEVPHRAAEFAIGGAAQAGLGLARDDPFDRGCSRPRSNPPP